VNKLSTPHLGFDTSICITRFCQRVWEKI